MKVFILGGTGSIGRAILAELANRSHQVVALSRSESSDNKLIANGATPLRGDLTAPQGWVNAALSCDAIIQVAATFEDDMAEVDFTAMSALVMAAKKRTTPTRLLYTGGCWLYGETKGDIADETRPFDPLEPFAFMLDHAQMLLDAAGLQTAIVHPAMVYDATDGGVFNRFIAAAKADQPIEIWGSAQARWPLIESSDLARAYCDLLDHPELTGHFNAVAEKGTYVGEIASALAQAYGSTHPPTIVPVADAIAEHGAWAAGPALEQQLTAHKLTTLTGWTPKITDYRRAAVMRPPLPKGL